MVRGRSVSDAPFAVIRRISLVLAAGAALMAVPAAAQSGAPRGVEALAYRLPAETLHLEALPAEALPAPTANRPLPTVPEDAWLGRDKALHFGASFVLTLAGQYVFTDKADLSNGAALPLSASVALGVGIAKEVADSQRAVNPLFSLRDLAADALGVAVGALVTRL